MAFAGNESYLGVTRTGPLVIAPFTGFFSPVDSLPTLNTVNAGSSIPVKFSLGGNRGLAIFATGYPLASKITCDSGLPVDAIEETTTAASGLVYDAATNQYKYTWKTPKNYAGLCYRLDLKMIDGSTLQRELQVQVAPVGQPGASCVRRAASGTGDGPGGVVSADPIRGGPSTSKTPT